MRLLRIFSSLLIIAAVSISLNGCSRDAKKKSIKKYISVQAVPVKEMHLVENIETTGDVIAANTVIIRATVEGPINFCPWREGDYIKEKGEKLIVIDRPIYREDVSVAKAELEVARAVLADLKYGPRKEEIEKAKELVKHYKNCTHFAKINFERKTKLVSKNVLSRKEQEDANVTYMQCKSQFEVAKNNLSLLEQGTKETEISVAETNVEKAKAQLSLAQAQLDECIIKAPFAGIVTQVYVRPGDVTSLRSGPRPPLMKIMDSTSLVIKVGLPENCAVNIIKGTKVTVSLDAYPGQVFDAAIVRVYPRIEPNSRTRIVEVKVNDKIKLLPNMFARISVKGRSYNNALVIPDSAIITTPRGEHVVFIVRDGKAEMQKVKIGIEEKGIIQLLTGVKAGDLVVTAGNLNLKNGSGITIINKAISSDRQKPREGGNK
jgi:HlyD family secretion protein